MMSNPKIASGEILKVGQPVEVSILTDTEDNKYTSRIEDFDSKNLILAMPMVKGYPIIPMIGSVINVRLVLDQSSYRFTSVYLNKKATPIPVWVLAIPKEVEKVQLREFVRVETMLPLKVQVEDAEHNLLPPIPCSIRDVSGGGIQLVMKQFVPPGTRVYVDAEIPDVGALQTYCEVVRSIEVKGPEKIFWSGTKFVDLSEVMRTKLIKFIFKRQRDLLQKKR
jgi:c-di-GMP-binding flagellar brake protein YcgR